MAYRNGNYAAFYVDEPFSQSDFKKNSTKDFVSYNMLNTWKIKEPHFPFVDTHERSYRVRDGSDWDQVLKPRIHELLNKSKNILLFLSSRTKTCKALHEEMDYGINAKGLPIIVIYTDFCEESDIVGNGAKVIKPKIKKLWEKLPVFNVSMKEVPTMHIPNNKALILKALKDSDFTVGKKCQPGEYFYPC